MCQRVASVANSKTHVSAGCKCCKQQNTCVSGLQVLQTAKHMCQRVASVANSITHVSAGCKCCKQHNTCVSGLQVLQTAKHMCQRVASVANSITHVSAGCKCCKQQNIKHNWSYLQRIYNITVWLGFGKSLVKPEIVLFIYTGYHPTFSCVLRYVLQLLVLAAFVHKTQVYGWTLTCSPVFSSVFRFDF